MFEIILVLVSILGGGIATIADFGIGSFNREFVVHFVNVMHRLHEKMHLNNFEMEFCIRFGFPQKDDSLVVGDAIVDLDVV